MSEEDLAKLLAQTAVSDWRKRLACWVESSRVQTIIMVVILINAAILGLETNDSLMAKFGSVLLLLDKICLFIFVVELAVKLLAYRWAFWRSGWNLFDFLVVAIAFIPGNGAWSVLRSLRVLRVLRLLTVVPQLRRVVAAFIHAIPGLLGVVAVMLIFYYTAAVLATNLFGETHPVWFGSVGDSFFTLFQIMTLESWSMGIVRPVMETHPWAWAFFVPFIIVATFTILNLFIGIIVSTMQELGTAELSSAPREREMVEVLDRIETQVRDLKAALRHKSED